MPAARLWRITGIDPWGSAGLELSALHLYDGTGRVDAGAVLTCSHAPATGTLAALQDADSGTLCAFDSAVVRSPGFWLQWDMGAGNTADVWGLRVGAGAAQYAFLSTCFLQYFDGSAWVAAECGAYPWPGGAALTDAPIGAAMFNTAINTWTERPSAGSRNWYVCASSADGQRLVAGAYGGYIYTSADAGATWTERPSAGSRNWYVCASSADGQRLVAGTYGGYIYTSLDGGATWTERTSAGSRQWYACASSADGQRLVAGEGTGGYLYTSLDGGATWTERTSAGSRQWYACASSADGQRLVAGAYGGYIYTSLDGGATWTERTSAGSRQWHACASSADGLGLLAGVYGGYIYTSADAGATWTERPSAGRRNWSSCSSSADGLVLLAGVSGNGYLYTSFDGGATWTERTSAGSRQWHACASSADGQRLVAGAYGGYIYASALRSLQFPGPRLRTARTQAAPVFTRPPGHLRTIAAQRQRLARDTTYGGNGAIRDTVELKATPSNAPLRRRVRLYSDRSGEKARETWSDAATGIYEFTGLDTAQQFTALAVDHERVHQAVAADNLTPKVLP